MPERKPYVSINLDRHGSDPGVLEQGWTDVSRPMSALASELAAGYLTSLSIPDPIIGKRWQGQDGLVGSPDLSWVNDTSSGRYRISPGVFGESVAGTLKYQWDATNFTFAINVLFSTDNSKDIGSAGALRPRTMYLGTDLIAGGNVKLDGYIEFNEIATPAAPATNHIRLYTIDDQGRHFLEFIDEDGVVGRIQRDVAVFMAKNTTGGTLPRGTLVYINGGSGGFPTIAKAKANSLATLPCMGYVTTDAANNAFVKVMGMGRITGTGPQPLDTSAFVAGDVLYLSASTAGTFTKTKPVAPNFEVPVGIVMTAHAVTGSILKEIGVVVYDDIKFSILTAKGSLISASAASTPTELTVGTDGKFLKADSTQASGLAWDVPVDTGITQLTGDVTAGPGSGSQAAMIAANAVTNTQLADMATQTFKGRTAAGVGDPQDLNSAQATAILDNMQGDAGGGGKKGLAPAPAAGDAAAGKFLKADATWSTPPDTGITQLTGDVTAGPGSGSQAATIANDAVTYAKIQNVSATDKVLGRATAGAGDVEEIACTAAGRAIIDDADASAQRTTLGLGAIAVEGTPLALSKGGTGFDASSIAKGGLIVGTGAGTAGLKTVGADATVLTADAASAGGVKWAAAASTYDPVTDPILAELVGV